MAFTAANNGGFNPSQLTRRIIKNSVTLNVGDAVVSYPTGFADVGVAAAPILGIVIGFENALGQLIRPAQVTKGTTSYPSSVNQVIAASDNQTNKQQVAVVCTDPSVTWSAAVNGTIGATNSSNLPSAGIDVDSADTSYGQVLETTATRTAATLTNFVTRASLACTSIDPNDSTRLLVSISCSEIFSSAK